MTKAGKWDCRWSYLATSGQVRPYVDDTIEFKPEDIHGRSGVIRGTGSSPYDGGSAYEVFGRVSKRHMGLMFYQFEGRLAGLLGVMILRLEADGNIYGWWLGIGKENSDVGGRFVWTPSAREPKFELRQYDYASHDPPARPSALTAPSIT